MAATPKFSTALMSNDDMLNDKNYETWSRKARILLIERDVLEAITENLEEPVMQNGQPQANFNTLLAAYYAFRKKDQVGRLVLLAHMKNDYMLKYERLNTAREVWERVREDLGGTTRQLQMSFDKFMKRPNVTMRQHLTIMKSMITELVQVGQLMTDEQQVQAVIRSLPKSWENIKSQMAQDDNIRTFSDIQRHCEMAEDILNLEKPISEPNAVSSKQLKAPWNKKDKGKRKANEKGEGQSSHAPKRRKVQNKAVMECYRCKKPGHFARECKEPEVINSLSVHTNNVDPTTTYHIARTTRSELIDVMVVPNETRQVHMGNQASLGDWNMLTQVPNNDR
ncbi:hypothetical protein ACHQM5_006053 [Ranunculus cassubicifolius]